MLWEAKWISRDEKPQQNINGPWQIVSDEATTFWSERGIYREGDCVSYEGAIWEAKWWNRAENPNSANSPWKKFTTLTVVQKEISDTLITLSVEDDLVDSRFGGIVPLAVAVPQNWKYVKSRQGDIHTDIVAVENGVALVTALPENGDIILQSEEDENSVGFVGRVVDSDSMKADYFYNKNIADKKPLILIGGMGGGKMWSHLYHRERVMELVNAGYGCLSLAYFKYDGLSPLLRNIPLEFIEPHMAWLKRRKSLDCSKISMVGVSKGGELGLLLASKYSEISKLAALVPPTHLMEGQYYWGGEIVGSWNYNGENLPFAYYNYANPVFWDTASVVYQHYAVATEEALQDLEVKERVRIPVEDMSCELFLVSAKNDTIVPAYGMCVEVMESLEAANYPHKKMHLYSENGGHSVWLEEFYWNKLVDFIKE